MTDSPLPTTPEQLLSFLNQWDISYELHHHEAMFTCADTKGANLNISGSHCRNLFLRDNKKKNYLICLLEETQLDLKKLPEIINSKRLSFGSPERLWQYLGIRPGSVCPFTAINDKESEVSIILEKDMMTCDEINFHPLDNTMTVTVSPDGLRQFFVKIGRGDVQEVDLRPARPI